MTKQADATLPPDAPESGRQAQAVSFEDAADAFCAPYREARTTAELHMQSMESEAHARDPRSPFNPDRFPAVERQVELAVAPCDGCSPMERQILSELVRIRCRLTALALLGMKGDLP